MTVHSVVKCGYNHKGTVSHDDPMETRDDQTPLPLPFTIDLTRVRARTPQRTSKAEETNPRGAGTKHRINGPSVNQAKHRPNIRGAFPSGCRFQSHPGRSATTRPPSSPINRFSSRRSLLFRPLFGWRRKKRRSRKKETSLSPPLDQRCQ